MEIKRKGGGVGLYPDGAGVGRSCWKSQTKLGATILKSFTLLNLELKSIQTVTAYRTQFQNCLPGSSQIQTLTLTWPEPSLKMLIKKPLSPLFFLPGSWRRWRKAEGWPDSQSPRRWIPPWWRSRNLGWSGYCPTRSAGCGMALECWDSLWAKRKVGD